MNQPVLNLPGLFAVATLGLACNNHENDEYGSVRGAALASASTPTQREADASSEAPATLDAVAPPRTRICDGSTQLRLQLFDSPVGGGGTNSDCELLFQNGYLSFAIDGTCHYWINGGWLDKGKTELGWHTGTIDADLEAVLDEALDLEHLESLNGCRQGSAQNMRSAASRSGCYSADVSNVDFDTAWNLVGSRASSLYEGGAPMMGALHIFGRGVASNGGQEFVPWPLSTPVGNYFPLEPETSVLVEAGPDAEAVRQLRDAYFSNPAHHRELRVNDHGTFGFVVLQDALPYENERGLLPFSDQN